MSGLLGRLQGGLVAAATVIFVFNGALAQTTHIETPPIRIKPPTIKSPRVNTPAPGVKGGAGTTNPRSRGRWTRTSSSKGSLPPGPVGVGHGTTSFGRISAARLGRRRTRNDIRRKARTADPAQSVSEFGVRSRCWR